MSAKRHRHEFTALWTHFGPYGDQTVHYHVCFTEGCYRVLLAEGRECDGSGKTHRRFTLTEAGPKRRAA